VESTEERGGGVAGRALREGDDGDEEVADNITEAADDS